MLREDCTVKDCKFPHLAKGFCRGHYALHRRGKDVNVTVTERSPRKPCKECPGVAIARGLCSAHYQKWKMENNGKTCRIKDCGRSLSGGAKELCISHYHRHLKGEDINVIVKRRRDKGEGTTTREGYRKVVQNGAQLFEHRLIMENSLGRPLTEHETVHHKNGDRADNRLTKGHELHCPGTCCNLELWSKSQPYGQRVQDKIAWAKMLLAEYGSLTAA